MEYQPEFPSAPVSCAPDPTVDLWRRPHESAAETELLYSHASRSAVEPYEQEDTLDAWLNLYEAEKERAFIQCIDHYLPPGRRRLLDIGCGTGFHTALWSERDKEVTASDFSSKFRDYIERHYGFPFIRTDVLRCTIREQYDICFCMAIATILLDEGRRFQTFHTLARLVRPGGYLVLETPSNQWLFTWASRQHTPSLHSLAQRDLQQLEALGFAVQSVFYWGSTPKRLWRRAATRGLAVALEHLASRLAIGARKVVICQRRPAERPDTRPLASRRLHQCLCR